MRNLNALKLLATRFLAAPEMTRKWIATQSPGGGGFFSAISYSPRAMSFVPIAFILACPSGVLAFSREL